MIPVKAQFLLSSHDRVKNPFQTSPMHMLHALNGRSGHVAET